MMKRRLRYDTECIDRGHSSYHTGKKDRER